MTAAQHTPAVRAQRLVAKLRDAAERVRQMEDALRDLVAHIDAGQSPDYAALQEHVVMRRARAIAKAEGSAS